MTRLFSFMLIFCYTMGVQGQESTSPYNFNWKKDAIVTGVGLGVFAGGAYFNVTKTGLTPAQLNSLDVTTLNTLDRNATRFWSPAVASVSDGFLYGSFLLPFSILAIKQARKDWLPLAFMYAEVGMFTIGLTEMSKGIVQRVRPYAYNKNLSLDIRLGKDARASFFSGHTSTVAAYSFLTAKLFHDYTDNKAAKIAVWSVAALIPIATGYLRYRSGKHFPTDMITGYLVGGAIGYFVPFFHKKKLIKNEQLSITPFSTGGFTGVYLSYRL